MTDPRIQEAVLLAEFWKRSTDDTTRRLGADLAQVLEDDDTLPAGFNRPMTVDKRTLLATLAAMIAAIGNDDSAGGFVQYEWADEPGKFEVKARYRIGNSMGQGGMRILHE